MPWRVTSLVALALVVTLVLPGLTSALSIPQCENGQKFDEKTSNCDCNTDPKSGPTFRGVRCQWPSIECGGAVFCLGKNTTCQPEFNTQSFACQCPSGTRGAHCEQKAGATANICPDKTTCQNGGKCQKLNNVKSAYVCRCDSGFAGSHCEINAVVANADLCGPQLYCLHGGRCNEAGTACTCASGFTGKTCGSAIGNAKASGTPGTPPPTAAQTSGNSGGFDSGMPRSNKSKLSAGAIAGICIGGIVALLIILVVFALAWQWRGTSSTAHDEESDGKQFITNPQINSSHDAATAKRTNRVDDDVLPA